MLHTKIHIAISAIGALLGLSAFVCFCIVFANIEAGMWALMSGKLFSPSPPYWKDITKLLLFTSAVTSLYS